MGEPLMTNKLKEPGLQGDKKMRRKKILNMK